MNNKTENNAAENHSVPLAKTTRLSCKLKDNLPKIVDEILENYRQTPSINHIGSIHLPSMDELVELIELIREILFPGYFGKQDLCDANVNYYVGEKIDELFVKLSRQVSKSFQHECRETSPDHACDLCRERAEKETVTFLHKIPKIRLMLVDDVQAAYDGDPAAKSLDEIIFSYPCIAAISVYRVAHELHIQGIPLMPRMMTEYAHSKTGIDIHPGAKIGKSFFIDHGTGVVIGETCEIGDNVKIYQGVTLGALSFPKDERGRVIRGHKRHPTIEDNVTIYSGATLLGGKTKIGKSTVIGGNVWLTHSIPSNTKVVIEPPHQQIKTRESKE